MKNKSTSPSFKTDSSASVLSDPFETSAMESFYIHCTRGIISKEWEYGGRIEFKKNDTDGSQRFKAGDLNSLLKKMEAFLVTLDQDR